MTFFTSIFISLVMFLNFFFMKSSCILKSPKKTLTVLIDDQRRSNHHVSYEFVTSSIVIVV